LNGGVLVVDCTETRVCTAIDPQQKRPKAFPLPDRLVQAFSGKTL
jgi:hypothetical protein